MNIITKKGDPENARLINRTLILNKIRIKEQLSRADLARVLLLSKMTVSTIVTDLINEGLIIESGEGDSHSQGGRKSILLRLPNTGKHVLGVDVGNTNTVVALASINGIIRSTLRNPTRRNHTIASILEQIKEMIGEIIIKESIPLNNIIGIGVSIGGLVNKKNGIIVLSPDFNWENVRLQSLLEKELDLPVVVDNCTRVMALGENWGRDANRYKNMVYINVGYGIGSAIVMNGKIYDNNSEFGHIFITRKGVKCDCGKVGCLEALSSGHAIEKRANRKMSLSDNHWYTAEEVAGLAMEGNLEAKNVFIDAGRYLGRAIAIVANLFNPDKIIIGGGVSKAGKLLLNPIMKEYELHTMNVIIDSTQVQLSSHGMEAGIQGAIALALDQYVFHTERI
jgi:predicted NBD/HSP70 family sugar kinase